MGDASDEPRWPPQRIAAAFGLAVLLISGFAVARDGPSLPMPGWAWVEVLAIGLIGTGLTAILTWVRPRTARARQVVGRQFLLGSMASFVAASWLVEAQVRASDFSPQLGFSPSPYWFIAIAAGLFVLSFPYERALARRFPSELEKNVRGAVSALMPTSTDVLVDGWSKEDLGKIIAEFLTLYGLEDGMIATEGDGPFRLSFSEPLSVNEFMFLVNYLPYPIGKDLEGRHIVVVGRSRVSAAMKFGKDVPVGSDVHFHVPVDDGTYDCVMAQTLAGPFLMDFGASKPRRNTERRESAAQLALANSRPSD
jgi:hypothetical protein